MSCCDVEDTGGSPASKRKPLATWRLITSLFVTGQIMVVGLAVSLGEAGPRAAALAHLGLLVGTSVVVWLVGASLGDALARSIRQRRASFDWLFATAIFGSLVHSFVGMSHGGSVYFEVTALLFVVHAMGERANRSRREEAVERTHDLMDQPELVRKLTCCGSLKMVPLRSVSIGDRVRVSPGEVVPVDGEVEDGMGWLDAAWWSGESLPSTRRVGDQVLAGTYVIDGALTVRASAAVGERRVDMIRARVAEARARPGKIQRTTDEMARWMLPGVVVVAAATFAFWSWNTSMSVGWLHAMAVLLVACPCAMGFATPVAFWVAIRDLAVRGVVARGGETIEMLARVDLAMFDKTGVLTDPEFGVSSFHVLPGESKAEVLGAVHALESTTSHPVARVIAEGTRPWRDPALSVSDVEQHPGQGLEGEVRGPHGAHRYRVGRFDADAPHDRLSVFRDGETIATLDFGEVMRPNARSLRDSLGQLNIEMLVLTGDRRARAEKLGLPVKADLLPEEKHDIVSAAVAGGAHVLFVGDGINDAAAMAESQVSIVAAAGAALPRSVADAVWVGRDLNNVVDAIRVAKRTLSVIRSNIAFAAFYNVVGMGAAAMGLLHPGWAAVLMTGSSFLVTLRSGAYDNKHEERCDVVTDSPKHGATLMSQRGMRERRTHA